MTDTLTRAAIGAPVYGPNDIGWIYEVKEPENKIFTIGESGMVECKRDISVVWINETTSQGLSEHNVQHWLDKAMHEPATPEKIKDLLDAAKVKKARARQKRLEDQERGQKQRAEFEAKIAPLVPATAKAVIIAELVEDKCDYASDYHGSATSGTIILALSNHERDIFSEMRKAALNSDKTAHLADAPKDAEHRQKYSMGGGYFLKDGYRHSSGWKISKRRISGPGDVPTGEICLQAPKPQKVVRQAIAGETPLGVTIEPHTHTKKGFDMWIVCLAHRVEREEYLSLLSHAKTLGGWYSRKWGNSPAGFAFKVEAKAQEFAASLGDGPTTTEAAPRVDISERLEALAAGMQKDIDSKRGDRRANTPKQRREAAKALQDADDIERAQSGLVALAALHKSGEVPAILQGVKTKKAALELGAERFDYSESGYYDAGRPTGKPAVDSDQARAFWALVAPKSAEQIKADKIKALEMKVANIKIDGYFPTPPDIIGRMIEAAGLEAGESVLEPSAGCGRIAEAVHSAGGVPSCVEPNGSLCEILGLKGFSHTQAAFEDLANSPLGLYDHVIMNPPFEKGQDVDHVRLAHNFLKPGGRLVAIMSPSWKFRQQRKFVEFREWLETVTYEVETLPSGSFKSSGTGVETVMIVIEA